MNWRPLNMPEITIRWTTAGEREQDKALTSEIMDFAMELLDSYDPDVSGFLGERSV